MEKQKKVLKWLETALPKMISKYDVQEQTDNEKELYEWVKKQADDNAKNRYHSKIDCSILTAYKQGFIRGFYFLYNKLNEVDEYENKKR